MMPKSMRDTGYAYQGIAGYQETNRNVAPQVKYVLFDKRGGNLEKLKGYLNGARYGVRTWCVRRAEGVRSGQATLRVSTFVRFWDRSRDFPSGSVVTLALFHVPSAFRKMSTYCFGNLLRWP